MRDNCVDDGTSVDFTPGDVSDWADGVFDAGSSGDDTADTGLRPGDSTDIDFSLYCASHIARNASFPQR